MTSTCGSFDKSGKFRGLHFLEIYRSHTFTLVTSGKFFGSLKTRTKDARVQTLDGFAVVCNFFSLHNVSVFFPQIF